MREHVQSSAHPPLRHRIAAYVYVGVAWFLVPFLLVALVMRWVGEFGEWSDHVLYAIRERWLLAVRRWAGLAPDGRTLEAVAAQEAKRVETLRQMRVELDRFRTNPP